MTAIRRLVAAFATLAVLTSGCVAPGSEGAPRPTAGRPTPPPPTVAPSTAAAPAPPPSTLPSAPPELPPPPVRAPGETICDAYDGSVSELATVASAEIVEASGIAASRVHEATFWVVNDSGHAATLHAVGADGSELAALPVAGATAFDWEDIAVGPGPEPELSYVYVGDIGDNLRLRATINLLRFPEPNIGGAAGAITDAVTIRLVYPTAPEDSEAMWVDPITGDVYVVTKGRPGVDPVVYRAALPAAAPPAAIELEVVAALSLDGQVTAADVTTDGAVVALRGYDEVWMWTRRQLEYEETFAVEPCLSPSPDELQGEALGFVPGELSYVTLSEGSSQPLNLVTGQ